MNTSLYSAMSGLRNSKYTIDVISNNIANKDNDDYISRTANSSENRTNDNGVGTGVSFDGVSRNTNVYLFYKMVTANSQSNYYSEKDTILSNAEVIFEETDSSGTSYTLGKFFDAIDNLNGDLKGSSSTTYKEDLKTQGNTLVANLKSVYSSLKDLNEDNLSKLKDQTSAANEILEQIQNVNYKMQQNGESNDLLDKRDALEKELSNYVDVDVDKSDGNYNLSIGGESIIFNTSYASKLEVKEEYIKQKDIYTTSDLSDSSITNGDPVTVTLNNGTTFTLTANTTSTAGDNDVKQQIVDAINNSSDFTDVKASLDTSGNLILESKNGGEDDTFDISISVNGTEVSKNDALSKEGENKVYVSSNDEELDLSSGSMKALTESLTTETSEISEYKKNLNDFAKTLVETFNSNSSTTMFKGSSIESLEFSSDSIDSLTQSDLENLAKIRDNVSINIDSDSSETTSFTNFYKSLLTKVSANVESNNTNKSTQDTVLNSFKTTFSNLAGVDEDEELINLMAFQKAYEANAKIITAVDEMLQTILDM